MLGERVLVIGSPGSGKSTFARRLALLCGLPLVYLDRLYWNSDRTTVSKEEFRRRLREVLQEDRWLIDGNYLGTMELRMGECQTVFFLDFPVETCLEGVRSRRGKERPDMPWIELEEDPEFMEFIRQFPRESRPRILELQRKYPRKHWVVFHTRAQEDAYLRGFQAGRGPQASGQS
ncbi:MAG: adenylate kinase [Acutalibacter sp.]|jgi:adenylate kinase family enzyme